MNISLHALGDLLRMYSETREYRGALILPFPRYQQVIATLFFETAEADIRGLQVHVRLVVRLGYQDVFRDLLKTVVELGSLV
jgi:hypothetical protein